MELWERAEALEALEHLLAETAAGGLVAVVAGEAGIGKSALVAEFARRSASRALVLWGACDRLVTPRALGPLHDIGRQTGGVLADRLRAGAAQEEIFAAFLDELSAPHRRLRPVVVVEDAHWADEATLDWLAFFGRRLDRLPALLVVTHRDDEVGPEHPLRGVLATLPSAGLRRIPVAALSESCVLDRARESAVDPAMVRRLAGGNPLLVTELLKAGEPGTPGAVQDLILHRVAALPEPARDLAELVAVVPTRAEPALLGAPRGALDACISGGVLVPAGRGVGYRHELLRSAVEAALAPTRHAELNARVLDLLSALDDVDPSRMVHHAQLSGDVVAVLRYGQVAGAGAARQGAHREAAAHYRVAVAYADRLPDPERAALLEAYAYEEYLTGRHGDALRARESAATIRESLGQPEQLGDDLRWVSRLAWWSGRVEYARAVAKRAVRVLESVPPSRALAMAYSNQAQLHLTTHELDQAVALARRAQALAEELGDDATAIHATVSLGTARLAAGDLQGAAVLEDAHVRAVAAGHVDHAARALENLALVYADEIADYASAVPRFEAALRYTDQHELAGLHLMVLGGRAKLRLEMGDWDGALGDARKVLASSGVMGVNAILPLVVLGRVQAARGDDEGPATLEAAAQAAAGVDDVPMLVPVADALAEHHLWAGRPQLVVEHVRPVLDLTNRRGANPFFVGRLRYRLWRAGDEGGGEDLAGCALPWRLMIEGDWAGAADEWERRGAAYLRAEALGLGDDEGAAADALRTLDGLGATRAAEVLRGRLRRQGVVRVPRGPRRATAANAAGLTPRQVDVLVMVAEGLSNADIAERLMLSTKTVDHHVSAVLSKLGVGNRSQAVAAARRMRLL